MTDTTIRPQPVVRVRGITSPRVLGWFIGLGGALLVFALFVLALGNNPLEVLQAVVGGAFGSSVALNRSIARTIPLLLLSSGLILAFRARFWNIGLNGSMYIGAIAASGIALSNPNAPGWLIAPLMLLAAVVAGAVWSLIPGLMRIGFGAPEIIVSLLLNYVAARIGDFLVFSYWKDPNGRGFPGTATFNADFWLPRLDGSNVHFGLVFGLLAVTAVWLLLARTIWGLEIDLIGQGPRAARYLGLNTSLVIVFVSLVSGALAGLAGAGEVAGLNHRLEAGITQDLGYTAILVVSLGLLRPWFTALCAVLVAGLLSGGTQLQVQFALPAAMAGVLLWAILYGVINGQSLAERLQIATPSGRALSRRSAPGEG
ncbi:MAG TPA: ABC transporter permease [Chloroflexota bacterium]|nr:ABC transporter permease [Chloroflexota bacterium]